MCSASASTRSIRGVVLEGCSAAGKTSVLKALKRRHSELGLERSVVVLSEHYSQALQRIDGDYTWLTKDEHRQLLGQRLDALEALAQWSVRLGDASRESRGVFFVLERFHLNHRMTYPEDTDWIGATERRLADLKAVCFLLTVSDARVAQRVERRLRSASKASGPADIESAARQFLAQQQQFLRASEQAAIRTVIVNTDDQNWDRCAVEILDAFDAT